MTIQTISCENDETPEQILRIGIFLLINIDFVFLNVYNINMNVGQVNSAAYFRW